MNSILVFSVFCLTFGQIVSENLETITEEKSVDILFCNANREIRLISLNDSLLNKPNVFKRRRDRKLPERITSKTRSRRNRSDGVCNNDIDYDIEDNYLIWSNISSILIAPLDKKFKNSLNINSKKVLMRTEEVKKISLDWVHDILYYIESGEIKVMDVKNQKIRTLSGSQQLKSNAYNAIDIVVNPIDSFIVWIRWDKRTSEYKLIKADQNGDNQKILLNLGFYGHESEWLSPCCLAIDYDYKRIFFIDNKSQTLQSVLFDGTKKTNHIYSAMFAMTNSIDIYDEYIFWSNRAQNSILATHKLGKLSSIKTIMRSDQNIESIRILHHSRQPQIENRCQSSQCTDICIPSPNEQYICVCDNEKKRENLCNESHYISSNITVVTRDLKSEEMTPKTKVNEIIITENHAKSYPLYVFSCQTTDIESKTNESFEIDWFTSDNQRLSVKHKKSPIAKNITRNGKDIELRISYPYIKLLNEFKCKATAGNQSFETLYKVIVRQMPTNPKILSHSLSFAGLGKVYLTLQIENTRIDPPIDKYRIAYRGIFNFYRQEYWVDFNALSINSDDNNDRNTIYVVKLNVDYTTQDLLAFKLYAHNDIGWSYTPFN